MLKSLITCIKTINEAFKVAHGIRYDFNYEIILGDFFSSQQSFAFRPGGKGVFENCGSNIPQKKLINPRKKV